MAYLTGKRAQFGRVILIGYVAVILAGGLVLWLPWASVEGKVPFLDALFTATSAVCVTGLTVVDTGSSYTALGQAVVLVLIQLGGFGVMTVGSLIAYALGRRISIGEREMLAESFGRSFPEPRRLVVFVFTTTVCIEALGALLFLSRLISTYPPGRSLWYAAFHSVSAFCNAGFSLWSDNFERFVGDPLWSVTGMMLIILGGLGFIVLADLGRLLRRRGGPRVRLTLHSRVVLVATAILIFSGAALILAIESFNPHSLGALPLGSRILASFFQSVTARTAGFNTVAMANLTSAGLLLIVLLMFVGASPASTGGGVKTSTFYVLVAMTVAKIRGRQDVNILGRRIAQDLLVRAMAAISVAVIVLVLFTMALSLAERGRTPYAQGQGDSLDMLFEVVSALGTVGLSTGITPGLSSVGKLMIMVVMVFGKVGPLTVAWELGRRQVESKYRLPTEDVMVG